MDFSIDASTAELLERYRSFLDAKILPLEPAWSGGGFPAIEAELARLRQAAKDAGLWGPQLPTELGGLGLSLLAHGMVSEVLGRSPLGHYVFGCQAPDAGNIELLERFGSTEQREKWLEPLAAGDIRSCFSMTEPENAGSNPTRLSCTARVDGDSFVIDGHKWFTTAADGAAFAIVMAVTEPDATPHKRASMIIVPTDTPGFQRVRNIPIMGHAGVGYGSHSEIRYEQCRVPLTNLLGERGAGFRMAQERLGPGRIHHCMRWLGICERSFDLMVDRAASRQLDDDNVLGDMQIVRSWIAEARAEINASRLLVLHAADAIDRIGFREARNEISMIKFHVADVLMRVVDRAIQVHGALGITDDTVLSYFYAHERGARIYDGPDEVHKMVVARRILGKRGEAR